MTLKTTLPKYFLSEGNRLFADESKTKSKFGVQARRPVMWKYYTATKFGSCLVLGVLTVGLYSLVIKTTETAFFPL